MSDFRCRLRKVEDLLYERGIDICHETVRFWWNRFGPMFAAEIPEARAYRCDRIPRWRWHLDEVFVKINGETHYLWRAVDHEGEVLEVFVTKTPGSQGCTEISRNGDEAARTAEVHRDRPASILRRRDEGHRRC